VLAAAGAAILIDQIRLRSTGGAVKMCVTGAIWMGAFAANYLVFLKPLGSNDYLHKFWADGYMPVPPQSLMDLKWFWTVALTLFETFAGQVMLGTLTALAGMCFVLGIIWLCRSGRWMIAALLLGPMIFALLGSAAKAYPFKGRLILFLAPMVILCVGWAFQCVVQVGRPRNVIISTVMFVFLAGPLVGYSAGRLLSPRCREEMRPLMDELAGRIQDGHAVYVHPAAYPQFQVYDGPDRLGRAERILTSTRDSDWSTYLPDLRELGAHERAWLILRVSGPSRPSSNFMRATLVDMGREVEVIKEVGLTAVLYDLTAEQ